jgi:hypothetical protein
MLCTEGTLLFRQFETAATDREVARDILLMSSLRKYKVKNTPFEDLMLVAKQIYSDSFVAWVTHRSQCAECKTGFGIDDQAQFASV